MRRALLKFGRGPMLVCAKIKNVKISAGGSTGEFAKICTRENFPLYGTSYTQLVVKESGKQGGEI